MSYASLARCVEDLEKHGQLKRIDAPIDPRLEMAWVQRRAFAAQAPALLFTRPKGCRFPMLANLFGTRDRVNFIFRKTLPRVKALLAARANPAEALKKPLQQLRLIPGLWHMRPKYISPANAPVLAHTCSRHELPQLVSWPEDGGAFITLPLVYSEDPRPPGNGNLGMYRIQISGGAYSQNQAGLHYQLQRGIGIHHAHTVADARKLPVNIHVGGPPALTIAAVMPLPEGLSELIFAGLLGGRRVRMTKDSSLPVLADADFVLRCQAGDKLLPEGPFGDHLGYYSRRHDFPVLDIQSIHHRPDAIWPFTSVGRPPQEDTVFGDLIHELTAPLVGQVFNGVREVHAVDAAGVHPLLLALGSERYTPYEAARKPRELLTLAMHLLGTTQTALAKYILIASQEDAPGLSCRNVGDFLRHMLERANFSRDLHFITASACDTLDYSGSGLHEGSRLIWASAGPKRRDLGNEIADLPRLPPGFGNPQIVMPGICALSGPPHSGERGLPDPAVEISLANCLQKWESRESFPLVVVVDDSEFCAASLENFLWVVFTRSDPATDCYGVSAACISKHWSCEPPLLIDARSKAHHAPPLLDDPAVARRMEALATSGGPLAGLFS